MDKQHSLTKKSISIGRWRLPFTIGLVGLLVLIVGYIVYTAVNLRKKLVDNIAISAEAKTILSSFGEDIRQLEHEHLNLMIAVARYDVNLSPGQLNRLRTLIDARITLLDQAYATTELSVETTWFANYSEAWTVLQPELDRYQIDPINIKTANFIDSKLVELEQIIDVAITKENMLRRDQRSEFDASVQGALKTMTHLGELFILYQVVGFIAFRQGFIARKERMRQVSNSNASHHAILNAIPDSVYRVQADGKILDFKAGNEFSDIHTPGFEASLRDQNFFEGGWDDITNVASAVILQVIETGEPHTFNYSSQSKTTEKTIEYEVRVLPSAPGEVHLIQRDITEQKQLEEAMRQTQKLESLGILAGGIAHDFNNLLTGMLGQMSLASYMLPEASKVRVPIEKAEISAQRAANLVNQLLAYAGKSGLVIEEVDLNELVEDNIAFLTAALPAKTQLRTALCHELALIRGDRGQMQQVVMNLIVNAAEATEGRGNHVAVATNIVLVSAETNRANFVGKDPIQDGRYVTLSVEDDGIGMPSEIIQQIFDPFFTTKKTGRGLGLSALLGIIRKLEGGIELVSVVNKGTCFRVYIPLAEQGVAQPVTQPVAPEPV